MERLNNIEEYKELVRWARATCKNAFSNNYFMAKDLLRYIEVGHAYVEKFEKGYLLILDEEKYYRVCFCLESEQQFAVPPLEKRTVVKNVYRAEKDEECPKQIEGLLKKMNFDKKGTSVLIKREIDEEPLAGTIAERWARKLEAKGWRCVELDETYYQQADELLISTGVIRDYQLDYKTPEEKHNLVSGSYLGVFNAKNELCAVCLCYLEGRNAHEEAFLILDEYKNHGLPMLVSYYRKKWMQANGVKSANGWILIDNEVSLRYHTSAGYELTNKYVDEWVREACD